MSTIEDQLENDSPIDTEGGEQGTEETNEIVTDLSPVPITEGAKLVKITFEGLDVDPIVVESHQFFFAFDLSSGQGDAQSVVMKIGEQCTPAFMQQIISILNSRL